MNFFIKLKDLKLTLILNSCNWTFVGPGGYTSKVGLKHGVNSGNLLIFCNSKILLIDYDVFDDADYSFFIEAEFCQIQIRKKKKGFSYNFNIPKDVDTPLNRKREEYYRFQRIDTYKKLAISFVVVGTIIMTGFLLRFVKKVQDLSDNAYASTVTLKKAEGHNFNSIYAFRFKKHHFNTNELELETLPDGTILTGNGMPLENHDEFHIIFSYKNPFNNRIRFDHPTFFQLSKYRDRLSEKLRELGPVTQATCDCIFDAVFEEEGMEGVANAFFQSASRKENPDHNQKTYERMLRRNPQLSERIANCR